jgi:hypoxanthine phosphoribosyltransferase
MAQEVTATREGGAGRLEVTPKETSTEISILFGADEIAKRVGELASRISDDYRGAGDLVVVGVLKGGVVFLCDLLRALEIRTEVEFIRVSSYGASRASSGVVEIVSDIGTPLRGKDVLVVDCIVDSGLTMGRILDHLSSTHGPRSLEVCSLLAKGIKARPEARPKYVGFEIGDKFVVGYGLDLAERYRDLPYVAVIK